MGSIIISPDALTKFLTDCRDRGLMEFDDAWETARLFTALVEGDWLPLLLFGMVDKVTEDQITAHASLVSRLFLKAIAPLSPSQRSQAAASTSLFISASVIVG